MVVAVLANETGMAAHGQRFVVQENRRQEAELKLATSHAREKELNCRCVGLIRESARSESSEME